MSHAVPPEDRFRSSLTTARAATTVVPVLVEIADISHTIAVENVCNLVSGIRRRLAAGITESNGHGIQQDPDPDIMEVNRAEDLLTDTTIAHADRDFVEWHGGIERYAAWVILIEEPSWLDWFAEARSLVADLLLPGYERNPHVTVLAAGLLAPSHLTMASVEEQATAVGRTDSATTTLRVVRLGASRSCPFIEVRDDAQVLPMLRSRLAEVHPEDAPQTSKLDHATDGSFDTSAHELIETAGVTLPHITPPHITLGLFRGSGSLEVVRRRLARVPQPDLPTLRVNTLHLCSYATRSVQGPLRVERETSWNRR